MLKENGVKSIAELPGSEETIAKLREVGIDYAQGFAHFPANTVLEITRTIAPPH